MILPKGSQELTVGALGLAELARLFQRIKNTVGALLTSQVPSYYDHCHQLAKQKILEMIPLCCLSGLPVIIFYSCHFILLFCHKIPPVFFFLCCSCFSKMTSWDPWFPATPLSCFRFSQFGLFLTSFPHCIVVNILYTVVPWIFRLCSCLFSSWLLSLLLILSI